jgi:adenylylsulfate kinase-like enzyme
VVVVSIVSASPAEVDLGRDVVELDTSVEIYTSCVSRISKKRIIVNH